MIFRKILAILDFSISNSDQHFHFERKKIFYTKYYDKINYIKCGRGIGLGYNVNIVLPQTVCDDDIKILFDTIILSIVNEFEPEVFQK